MKEDYEEIVTKGEVREVKKQKERKMKVSGRAFVVSYRNAVRKRIK